MERVARQKVPMQIFGDCPDFANISGQTVSRYGRPGTKVAERLA